MKIKLSSILVVMVVLLAGISFGETVYQFVELPEGYKTVSVEGFFHDGLLGVMKQTSRSEIEYDYVDVNGNLKNLSKYATGIEFSEGLAPIMDGEKLGYMDRTGKIIIPMDYTVRFNRNEGTPIEIYQYLKTGRFINGIAPVVKVRQINENGEIIKIYEDCLIDKKGEEVNENEFYIDLETNALKSKHYSGITMNRLDGHAFGDDQIEKVTYKNKVYDVKFSNDIGILYYYGNIDFNVRKTPIIVKKVHSTIASDNNISVNGTMKNYVGYEIDGQSYIRIVDLENLLSDTDKKFAVQIVRDRRMLNFVTGLIFSSENIKNIKVSGLPMVPKVLDYGMLLNGEKRRMKMYYISDEIYIGLESISKIMDMGLVRNDENKVLGINTIETYKRPMKAEDYLMENGRMKADIARKYIYESIESFEVINRDGKYYLAGNLAELPENFYWQPGYSVTNGHRGSLCDGGSRDLVGLTGHQEWELEGIKKADINDGADLTFSLYVITEKRRSQSIICKLYSYKEGVILERDWITDEENLREFDTSKLLKQWK